MNKGKFPLFQIFVFFCFSLLSLSCDILRDSPFEVEAWTPGEGFHADPGRIRVSLLLSHESDRAKTEQAFSFTEDRKNLKGNFFWEGNRLIFVPATPLEADRDYAISLGTGAQDTKGISLENKFDVSFTTRPPGGRPKIIRVEPGYEGSILESRGEFRLFFSAPVDLNSCMDYVSFSPSTPGSWRLEDENKTASFIPREPWQPGSLYKVKVDGRFSGISGLVLGEEYSTVFSIGKDREKPVLLQALVFSSGTGSSGASPEEIFFEKISPGMSGDFPLVEYRAWENFSRLEFVFSKPVETSLLKNFIVTEPSAPLLMESPPEISGRATFRFAEYPRWGSSFLFRLIPGVKDWAGNESTDEYVFKITCGGPLSKPPALIGIRLPVDGSKGQELRSYTPDDLFTDLPIKQEYYPFNTSIETWVELYFETAPETGIDSFSVMDLFRVDVTNHALFFSPELVTDSLSMEYPKEGWENFRRLEVKGRLTNYVESGVVTFRIPAGLRDKRGNRNPDDFRISLLK